MDEILLKVFLICRYPERTSDLDKDPKLLFTSSFVFKGKEGDLKLRTILSGPTGNILETRTYNQTDTIDRRYSVTTNRDSRYAENFIVDPLHDHILFRLPNQRTVKISKEDLPLGSSLQLKKDRGTKKDDKEDDWDSLISDSQDSLFLQISSQVN